MTASRSITTNKSTGISGYTEDQISLIKSTIVVGATNDELLLFLQVCKNHKLDPFTRQIHFVKRAGKGTIQISIDGFRAIAERTGNYAGNDDPVFDDDQNPKKATVTVWKLVNGTRCPFSATARWAHYYPGETQGFMWKKMPHVMLGKCAEALALRKAFPEALSGLYSDEEMQQASTPSKEEEPKETQVVDAVVKPVEKPKPTTTKVMEIMANTKTPGTLKVVYHHALTHEWTKEEAADLAECYLNNYRRIMDWIRKGTEFVTPAGEIVATVKIDEKGKASVVLAPKEPTEEEIATAERAGMQAA